MARKKNRRSTERGSGSRTGIRLQDVSRGTKAERGNRKSRVAVQLRYSRSTTRYCARSFVSPSTVRFEKLEFFQRSGLPGLWFSLPRARLEDPEGKASRARYL